MADPRKAFADNPMVPCSVQLDVRGISPDVRRQAGLRGRTEIPVEAEKSFAKAHYEQHIAVTGTITVGDEVLEIDGLGLRDKSWGPRYWQAVHWYRWLPMVFGPDFALMLSVIGGEDPDASAASERDGARGRRVPPGA